MNASRRILGRGWSNRLGHARGLIAQGVGLLAGDLLLRSCQGGFTISPYLPFLLRGREADHLGCGRRARLEIVGRE